MVKTAMQKSINLMSNSVRSTKWQDYRSRMMAKVKGDTDTRLKTVLPRAISRFVYA